MNLNNSALHNSTDREKSGDIKTATEVTKGFQRFDFFDPVGYDFSITRPGIHPEGNFGEIMTLIEGSKK
ncbi:MAG: DUF2400 family protein [Spirochaetaceae bacterium]